jgi:hypothetical protein
MGGRGQGVRRDRGGPRGGITNGRYDRVRVGSGSGTEWNNRWQVLDQTGTDVEIGDETLGNGNDDRNGNTERRTEEGMDSTVVTLRCDRE